jgi:hypothetical protein
MKIALRNREPRVALWVGALVAVATALVFAVCVILDEGGGSLSRGWNPGWSYVSFYGFFMLPIFAIVGLVAMGLSRLIGGGIVMLVAVLGLAGLLGHGAVSTTPAAQLARVSGRSGIPDLRFEQFRQGHTFSDGTSYLWVARCSADDATTLASALGLRPISAMVWKEIARPDGTFSTMVEHEAVQDYRGIFGEGIEGVEFYLGDQGMIGGYSSNEQRFRLYWWPALRRNNSG